VVDDVVVVVDVGNVGGSPMTWRVASIVTCFVADATAPVDVVKVVDDDDARMAIDDAIVAAAVVGDASGESDVGDVAVDDVISGAIVDDAIASIVAISSGSTPGVVDVVVVEVADADTAVDDRGDM
jgi:hypothetical protein